LPDLDADESGQMDEMPTKPHSPLYLGTVTLTPARKDVSLADLLHSAITSLAKEAA
jgi:hypothetical protein